MSRLLVNQTLALADPSLAAAATAPTDKAARVGLPASASAAASGSGAAKKKHQAQTQKQAQKQKQKQKQKQRLEKAVDTHAALSQLRDQQDDSAYSREQLVKYNVMMLSQKRKNSSEAFQQQLAQKLLSGRVKGRPQKKPAAKDEKDEEDEDDDEEWSLFKLAEKQDKINKKKQKPLKDR
eukprot:m.27142 g.27142  ORF g.27142 m.27142 type:complete len:180 (+) comp10037_c0_seq1:408-947(+)